MLEFLSAATDVAGQTVSSAAASAQPDQLSGNVDFTIVFILISLVVSIVLPVFFILWGKIRHKGSINQVFSGILGFLLFTLIMPAALSTVLFPSFLDQSASSFEVGIQVVIVVICTELGRYLLLFLSRKKRQAFGNAITFGSGYGIMEMLFVVVGFLIPYLIVTIGSEGSSINGIYRELRIFVSSNNLIEGKEWRFLVKGYICAVFILFQIYASVMMFTAVQKKKYWLAVLPPLFGVLINLPNKMSSYSVWYWGNLAVILPYLGIMTVVGCLVAYYFWKSEYKVSTAEQNTAVEE